MKVNAPLLGDIVIPYAALSTLIILGRIRNGFPSSTASSFSPYDFGLLHGFVMSAGKHPQFFQPICVIDQYRHSAFHLFICRYCFEDQSLIYRRFLPWKLAGALCIINSEKVPKQHTDHWTKYAITGTV